MNQPLASGHDRFDPAQLPAAVAGIRSALAQRPPVGPRVRRLAVTPEAVSAGHFGTEGSPAQEPAVRRPFVPTGLAALTAALRRPETTPPEA